MASMISIMITNMPNAGIVNKLPSNQMDANIRTNSQQIWQPSHPIGGLFPSKWRLVLLLGSRNSSKRARAGLGLGRREGGFSLDF